jgi:hypothetical protein
MWGMRGSPRSLANGNAKNCPPFRTTTNFVHDSVLQLKLEKQEA